MLLRCISAFKFPFVNYSLIRGRNDHQNVSKFSPYRVGRFVTKNRAYLYVYLQIISKRKGLLYRIKQCVPVLLKNELQICRWNFGLIFDELKRNVFRGTISIKRISSNLKIQPVLHIFHIRQQKKAITFLAGHRLGLRLVDTFCDLWRLSPLWGFSLAN